MVEVQRWEITVPGWVPDSRLSLNGRRRAHHWRETWQLQQDAKLMVIPAIWTCDAHPRARSKMAELTMQRARVSITLVYPMRRRRDPDGLSGLAKPLLDALVEEHVIVDDDSEHVELSVRALVEPGVTETRLVIEALPPSPAGGAQGTEGEEA
jgi:hypothetical protein